MAKIEDAVIYAVRMDGRTRTLVEVQSEVQLGSMIRVSKKAAQDWVLAGGLHETGLWVEVIDDEHRKQYVIRYAEASN